MTESHPIFDTFIFDLDGTILDTMPDLIHVTNETLAHFGYPTHTDAAIRSMIEVTLDNLKEYETTGQCRNEIKKEVGA